MAKVFLLIALVLVAFVGGNYLIGNNEKKEEKMETVEPAKTEAQPAPQTAVHDQNKEQQVTQPEPSVKKEESATQPQNAESAPSGKQQELPSEQSLEGNVEQKAKQLPEANKQ